MFSFFSPNFQRTNQCMHRRWVGPFLAMKDRMVELDDRPQASAMHYRCTFKVWPSYNISLQ